MERTPAYYRARLEVFKQLIEIEGKSSSDSLELRVLRNGVVPAKLQGKYDELISKYKNSHPNNQLSFDEITRFNTWFELHPEKVAGIEVVTTSREFPIKIKGTQEDIIQTAKPTNTPDKKDKRIRMAKAKAIARKRKLELLKF